MNYFLNLLDAAAETPTAPTGGFGQYGLMIVYLVVIGLVFFFFIIRPQKKKQKEEEKMRNSIQVGDEITTIGGIYGKIVSIKEDSYVIESVIDHSKIKIAKWAIQSNNTIHDDTPAK